MTECQNLEVAWLAPPPDTLYVPGYPEITRSERDSLTELMKVGVPIPTVGLVSDTNQSKGATINKPLGNLSTDIILGRKPVSSWDSAVKTWIADGGAKIGREYEAAYAHRPR